MLTKKYKAKFTLDVIQSLYNIISMLITTKVEADDDKLLFSVLADIKGIMSDRMDNVQKEATISFTPAQAFALRILSTDYVMNKTTQTGNRLHQISNEVHNFYQ